LIASTSPDRSRHAFAGFWQDGEKRSANNRFQRPALGAPPLNRNILDFNP
jgi:hypothetical protein